MGFKSFMIVLGIAVAMILSAANLAEARGFGNRGSGSFRLGIGRGASTPPRYYGPGFYAAPRVTNRYQPGGSQYDLRPWYYYQSGPFSYYRPYNQYYPGR